jgi:hypothetical protein
VSTNPIFYVLPISYRERLLIKTVIFGTKLMHDVTAPIEIKIPWPESARELYRLRDGRLSAKLVPTFADRRSHVVSVTDPYGRILGFIHWNRYFSFQVAPQLYSRG